MPTENNRQPNPQRDSDPISFPLPKKISKAIRNLSFRKGRENTPADWLAHVDKTVEKMGPEFVREMQSLYGPLIKRLPKLPPNATNEDLARQEFSLMGSIYEKNEAALNATVPIVLRRNRTKVAEVIGSGVFLNIHDKIFLLTAAHVLDQRCDGDLLIPGRRNFVAVFGKLFNPPLPKSGRREDDTFDAGYICLHPKTQRKP